MILGAQSNLKYIGYTNKTFKNRFKEHNAVIEF